MRRIAFQMSLLLGLVCATASAQSTDPRLAIDEVQACMQTSKTYMRSSEYSGQENEQALIGACRNADPDCVSAAGESLHPSETLPEKSFLEIVRACRGPGMGKCFRQLTNSMPSYDRRELKQILALLKKCL